MISAAAKKPRPVGGEYHFDMPSKEWKDNDFNNWETLDL